MRFMKFRTTLLLLCGAALNAHNTTAVLGTIAQTIQLSDIAVSPDGARIAWTQAREGERPALRVAIVSGGTRPVIKELASQREDSEPTFAPDNKHLAFFSTPDGRQKQLFIADANGNNAQPKTRLNGYAARPRWSHDGKRIAFLYVEGAGGGGPLLAAPAQTGVIDTAFVNQRIAVYDSVSGQVGSISTPSLHVYDFDWSPDGRQFVVTAAPGPGDNNWWVAQIYTVDAVTGSYRVIYKPKLQVALPRWSPDGSTIAFIEGLMSDEGFHGGDLFTMRVSEGTSVNRTANRKTSPSSFFWTANDRILLTEWVGGGSALSELSIHNGEIRTLWSGAESLYAFGNFPNLAASAGGKMLAAARSTFENPPEIWFGAPNEWQQLTTVNSERKPTWGKAENIEWTNQGFRVQGWLLRPASLEANRRPPMAVLIHGGPSNTEKPAWPHFYAFAAALSNAGYFVFMPNPRGSYGQGESFTRANVKDFGHGDLSDILTGVDTVLATFPIDPNRLGVTGWSYGGYMTMWTVTQTNRFRAAMAGAGIANWQSYYGQNLIDQWMIPFFSASVYDDPAVYRNSSPIEYIKNIKTPTLVIVGERDAECPAPQSYEFWHALRALGVKTQLVVYKDEGHLFMDPKNRADLHERLVAWFDENLK
jgi:dipeptidyl aminopeptidase/acylaminoacyl peptidase